MPKETFTRIAEDKRERLLREAAALFAERGYAQAELGELASRAGVAKGSLYNYFENKDDLYLHVCADALERSRRAVYGGLDPEWSVVRQIEHIFREGARFALARPELVTLYLDVASAGMERFTGKLSVEAERPTAERLMAMLEAGVSRGELRADLDVPATAWIVNGLYIMLLASMVSPHFKVRLDVYFPGLSDGGEGAVAEVTERVVGRIRELIVAGERGADLA